MGQGNRATRSVLSIVGTLLLASACQTTMSVEEAKKVTASFAGAAFVPPPRTINDITAILDQQKRDNPESVAQAKARMDQEAPKTGNPATLAEFHYQRGLAAREVGRPTQEIEDLTKAAEWSRRGAGVGPPYDDILWELTNAEIFGGKISHAIGHVQDALAAIPVNRRFAAIKFHGMLARLHAGAGNFDAAEAAAHQVLALVEQSKAATRFLRPEAIAFFRATAAETQARLAELRGQLRDAERFYRDALAELAADPVASQAPAVEIWTAKLAFVLVRQGRLLEAEKEARSALLQALNRRGRYAVHTANNVRTLAAVILAQGRYAEAETLARATIEIYAKVGATSDSSLLAFARGQLGEALVAQERWTDALAEFETIGRGLGDSEAFQTYFGGNPAWAIALLRTGRPEKTLEVLNVALERRKRLLGENDRSTAEVLGLIAVAHAAHGDKPRALREFVQAVPVLLSRSQDADDETASRPARDRRLGMVLTAYIGLLADVNGTPLEREAGIDAAAEAFRLADVARGQGVQRALDAGAARAAAGTPALADLVRREQDAKKQVGALQSILTDALSQPTDKQDPKALAALRTQIDTLRRARQGLLAQIEKEFPAYAELLNPKPATADQVRARLRPGEAVIATYVSANRTFVWAIPQTGAIAFAASSVGEKELETAVNTLRKALDPSATTLGEIPAFDLPVAHRIFQAVLEPVAPGWQKAESLLLVAHGPLAQVPFSLLVTRPATLGPETGAIFSNYRAVPWLGRTHAVTVLPSVTALATLRALPPGDPNRRPFLGFGDPFFSEEQARRAEPPPAAAATALAVRGVPIKLRSSPKTQGVDSSQLAMLPRLPETADEIRSVALAMNADLTRDVFTGAQANEKTVKTMDLSGYRVIAFATHGLVPGDLDGLVQPALALSAPGVAKVDGDGLLTMEEILGLRLNADWVVLSACNTASGQGAGSEAISGLGRAFFYAGARALLVSNWPVETTSARALTTDLFRRQSVNPRLTRGKALQETMNALIDGPGFVDPRTKEVVFSYAHPIFWAPFALVGDGGGN